MIYRNAIFTTPKAIYTLLFAMSNDIIYKKFNEKTKIYSVLFEKCCFSVKSMKTHRTAGRLRWVTGKSAIEPVQSIGYRIPRKKCGASTVRETVCTKLFAAKFARLALGRPPCNACGGSGFCLMAQVF